MQQRNQFERQQAIKKKGDAVFILAKKRKDPLYVLAHEKKLIPKVHNYDILQLTVSDEDIPLGKSTTPISVKINTTINN